MFLGQLFIYHHNVTLNMHTMKYVYDLSFFLEFISGIGSVITPKHLVHVGKISEMSISK